KWVFPIQTHENRVVEVNQEDRGANIDCLTHELHVVDGFYTFEKDVLLTMCYADCVPIYFYSEKHQYIGLAHAGWKGTVGQIVNQIVKHIPFDLNDRSEEHRSEL